LSTCHSQSRCSLRNPRTLAALFVYCKLGLAFLRTAWLNLDWIWAGALVVTGIAVLFR